MTALKGDLAGGISAGVLTIPVSMGYGVLALQPLGDGYVSHGVVAGLVSAIIVLLAGALLGGSAGLMYTPRSVVTLIMAAVILEGVARGPAAVAAHGDVQRTLTLVFFVVVAAGLLGLRVVLRRPVPEIISDRLLLVGCLVGLAAFLIGNWLAVNLVALR